MSLFLPNYSDIEADTVVESNHVAEDRMYHYIRNYKIIGSYLATKHVRISI